MSSEISPFEQQRLLILGEFYFKKGNVESAREIFNRLSALSPESFRYPYFLGKIEALLGNHKDAIVHLENTRLINPFHKHTLLALTKSYAELDMHQKALECLVDAYLLCKETKDSNIDTYKKKIRILAKKLPGMDLEQKNKLIKDRLKNLHARLNTFESIADETPVSIIEPEKIIYKQETHTFTPTGVVEYMDGIEEAEPEQDFFHKHEKEERNEQEEEIDDDLPMPELPGLVLNADFGLPNHPNLDFTRHILFKSLSPQEIEKIGKFSSIQTYAKDDRIHEPLEPIFGFSCLLEGKVQIMHQGTKLLELQSGSIIDEAELCYGDKYFFETRALEPSTILSINKSALLTLCKRRHELAVHFLWHFYKSLALKISAVLDNMVQLSLSKSMEWSIDRMWEVSQQRMLNELELDFLARKCTTVVKDRGNFLFTCQDPTQFFYILLEGEVELEHPQSKDRLVIAPGEMFSEMALISNNFEHSMSAKITSEQATLLQITRKELKRLRDPSDRDNYRMMEFLWNIFSKKYFEFVNFYFNLQKVHLKKAL